MATILTVKLSHRIAGRVRLFARDTWGELDKSEREVKAAAVMDSFQESAAAAGLNCTWKPRQNGFVFVETPTIPLPVDNAALRLQLINLVKQAILDNNGLDLPS